MVGDYGFRFADRGIGGHLTPPSISSLHGNGFRAGQISAPADQPVDHAGIEGENVAPACR
jgi:hypothetical protein